MADVSEPRPGDDRKPQAGDEVTLARTIAEDDLESFAGLSLDRNPLHFDEAFARSTFFGRRAGRHAAV